MSLLLAAIPPAIIGPELVVNGTFDFWSGGLPTVWTYGGGSVSQNGYTCDVGSWDNAGEIYQPILTPGKTYQWSVDLNGTDVGFQIYAGATVSQIYATPGNVSGFIVATGDRFGIVSSSYSNIDNVSVREYTAIVEGGTVDGTATVTGIVSTGTAGISTATGAGSATVAGVVTTSAIGSAVASGNSTPTVSGIASASVIGTVPPNGSASMSITGIASISSTGVVQPQASALAVLNGIASISQIGTVTATGGSAAVDGNVTVTGLSSLTGIGNATATGTAAVNTLGVSSLTQTGSIAPTGSAVCIATGIDSVANVGNVVAIGLSQQDAVATVTGIASLSAVGDVREQVAIRGGGRPLNIRHINSVHDEAITSGIASRSNTGIVRPVTQANVEAVIASVFSSSNTGVLRPEATKRIDGTARAHGMYTRGTLGPARPHASASCLLGGIPSRSDTGNVQVEIKADEDSELLMLLLVNG